MSDADRGPGPLPDVPAAPGSPVSWRIGSSDRYLGVRAATPEPCHDARGFQTDRM